MKEYEATVRVKLIVEAVSATEAEGIIGEMLDECLSDAEVYVLSSINAKELNR